MKKIVRLTESDLTRIVKKIIKENEKGPKVEKLISLLVDNNLVNKEDIVPHNEFIEVFSINGLDTDYFVDNYIRLFPYNIDSGEVFTEGAVFVEGEYYEDESDEMGYEDVLDYIYAIWEPILNLEFIV